jgi:MFS family permease
LISHTSDPKQQGTVFGLFHMLGSLARVIGPVIATAAYTLHHTASFWIAAGMTAAIAGWSAVLRGRMAPQAEPTAK